MASTVTPDCPHPDYSSCPFRNGNPQHEYQYRHTCIYGSNCTLQQSAAHCAQFIHFQTPQKSNQVIQAIFTNTSALPPSPPHSTPTKTNSLPQPCRYGLQCRLIAKKPDHPGNYLHPLPCKKFFACDDADPQHSEQVAHFCMAAMECSLQDDKHLSSSVHPCIKGLNCSDNSILHRMAFVHPCPQWQNCADQTEEHHTMHIHPCRFGTDCRHQTRIEHTLKYSHLCPLPSCQPAKTHMYYWIHLCPHGDVSNCPVKNDPEHLRKHFHQKAVAVASPTSNQPLANAQTMLTAIQKSACKFNYNCRKINDTQHSLIFHHNIVLSNGQVKLTLVTDKSKLQNCLEKRGNDRWKHTPQCPVIVSQDKSQGSLNGWDMNDYVTKTGKVLVRPAGSKKLIPYFPDELTPNYTSNSDLKAPWHNAELLVWESQYVTSQFDQVLQGKVFGMNVSFNTIFHTLFDMGIPVFVMGGSVRDLVCGKTVADINDIDFSYGCSAAELVKICSAKGWKHTSPSPFGLVQLGDVVPNQLYLEGKSIGGLNFDKEVWSTSAKSISTDLHMEAIYRDFTCNSLCYDPVNKVVIDPTGHGVEDSLFKILRIPAPPDAWELWFKGNPSKIFRYWKLLQKKYTPVDANTSTFIIKKAQTGFKDGHILRYMYNAVKKSSSQKAADEFKNLCVKDIGQQLWDTLWNS